MFSGKVRSKSIVTVLLFAALAFSTAFAATHLGVSNATAEENVNIGQNYFYQELAKSELAQKFYKVMEDMASDGSLDSGTGERDISDMLGGGEISRYAAGESSKIPVALGAARDAFYLDRPDLFYADVYKLTLTVGSRGDSHVAFLGTGRAENYYTDNTVSSAEQVATAKKAYAEALDKAVEAAKADGADVLQQIKNANKYISDNTAYDYGTSVSDNGDVVYDGYVRTAYGALVEGKAVCSGYASAFKAVMDRLNIPCVLIPGSGYSGIAADGMEAGYEPHMWNAVRVGDLWYGVDVTWNDTTGNLDKYLLVGDEFLSVDHVAETVISSSGFELKYPALRPFNYGVKEDENGFVFEDEAKVGDTQFGYIDFVSSEGDNAKELVLGVSYDGKDGLTLLDEGKYLVVRYATEKGVWTSWSCQPLFYKENMQDGSGFEGKYTIFNIGGTAYQAQFAVVDYAPDSPFHTYKPETFTDNHIMAISTVYSNDAYGNYIPAPYVRKMTPNETGTIKSFEPIKITLEYSEKLVYAEGKGKTDVGVQITSKHSDIADYAKATEVEWDEENSKLTFLFTPSRYYAHNKEMYHFVPTNLVGEKSGKVPDPGYLSFERKQVVCPKVFNDGRLYMQVFGQPTFVSASDESLNEFKDKNGKPIVGNLTSQLMLVVDTPTKAESQEMMDALLDGDNGMGLTSGDVKASSTYQIDLQMCGCVQKVPSGSYMQVGFGFPEGFSTKDEGFENVTFTVYHYTRNADGSIKGVEAVPCVITEYGIMATVKSFSPFMICAVDSSKASANKTVYASVYGTGGKIDNGEIKTVAENGSVTYTATCDDGYDIDRVLLNGKDITSRLQGGTLTLGYSELDGSKGSNELEFSFVSKRVAKYYADNGITVVQPRLIVSKADMIESVLPGMPQATDPVGNKSHTKAIVISVVVILVVLLAGGGVAFWLIWRKKSLATAGGGANVKARATKTRTAPAKSKTTTARNTSGTTRTSVAQSKTADKNKTAKK